MAEPSYHGSQGRDPMAPRISVIVPFYNAEHTIARCIAGLRAQTYPHDQYEILMIDNNSTDGSAAIARRYDGITLLAEARRGAYAARNRGLREARGEIIAFTDADCVPADDWLLAILDAMASPEVGIVVGSHRYADDGWPLGLLADYDNEKKRIIFSSHNPALMYGQTNNMTVRKALLDEEGGFVEILRGADTVFVRRCVARHSSRVIRYASNMQIRHLEIDGVGMYLRKSFIYGRSSALLGSSRPGGPITNREPRQAYARAIRWGTYSMAERISLFAILGAGFACFAFGYGAGRWSSRSAGAPTA